MNHSKTVFSFTPHIRSTSRKTFICSMSPTSSLSLLSTSYLRGSSLFSDTACMLANSLRESAVCISYERAVGGYTLVSGSFLAYGCGTTLIVIAVIENPDDIRRIFRNLGKIGRLPLGFNLDQLNCLLPQLSSAGDVYPFFTQCRHQTTSLSLIDAGSLPSCTEKSSILRCSGLQLQHFSPPMPFCVCAGR